jgi:hypothetical protein
MHEIISKISQISINSSEEEIHESLSELKSAVIQNGEISKGILSNISFVKSFEVYANGS